MLKMAMKSYKVKNLLIEASKTLQNFFGRWRERREAFLTAERAYNNLMKYDVEERRTQIIDTAKVIGFFSIWYGSVESYPQVANM